MSTKEDWCKAPCNLKASDSFNMTSYNNNINNKEITIFKIKIRVFYINQILCKYTGLYLKSCSNFIATHQKSI